MVTPVYKNSLDDHLQNEQNIEYFNKWQPGVWAGTMVLLYRKLSENFRKQGNEYLTEF